MCKRDFDNLHVCTKNYILCSFSHVLETVMFVVEDAVLETYMSRTKLFYQKMHFLLKHKMLQFIFKISFLIWLLHVSVPSDHHQGAYNGTLLKLQSL